MPPTSKAPSSSRPPTPTPLVVAGRRRSSSRIGDDWPSGFHLVTLTAHGAPAGRDIGHACFVVRGRPDSPARPGALFVLDTNTWHAYNTWGGRSLYTGGHTVSHVAPVREGNPVSPRGGPRRSQGPPRPLGRGARRRRHDLPALPHRARLPGRHRLGRLVHARPAIRRVGRARRLPLRLRRVVRPRTRCPTRSPATTP